jgi:hypothetical protein
MPRTLLLPIPHAIADKVHHTLQAAAETWAETGTPTAIHIAQQLDTLAQQLDTLAREAGVIGW